MEAATLRRDRRASALQSVAEAARARSRTFWTVVGLTLLGAVLRFATLGIQSYHHDEVVTAERILGVGFVDAMSTVGSSESTPPIYYALAWLWTQLVGTGGFGLRSVSALAGVATIPIAFLIAEELRGRRAGLMAAALVAVNPMLLWYSQEARAYALLVLFCSVSLLFCVRAQRSGERRDFTLWGVFSALALGTHYFAAFSVLAEAVVLLRRRGRASLAGLWIVGLAIVLLAPLALHQMSLGHAEWIVNLSLGHRLWETAASFLTGETSSIIGQPQRPELAFVPLALALAGLSLLALRSDRAERRAAAIPFGVGLVAIAVPVALALISTGKDYVLARNLMPALVPLLIAVAIGVTLPRARRLGTAIAAALLAYSLGFCIWASFSPELQRPDYDAVASRLGEPTEPRAMVTWAAGEAPLRYYLDSDGFQIWGAEGYEWLVGEVDFISDGPVPPPPPGLLGPGFRETASEDNGRLFIRRYATPGPGLEPLPAQELRRVPLEFRSTGVLLDGIGPG